MDKKSSLKFFLIKLNLIIGRVSWSTKVLAKISCLYNSYDFQKTIWFFLHLLFMLVFSSNLYISAQNYLHHINHILYKSLLFGGVRYTDYVGDCPLLSNGRGTWGYFHITQSHNRPTICLISLQSLYFHFCPFSLETAINPN